MATIVLLTDDGSLRADVATGLQAQGIGHTLVHRSPAEADDTAAAADVVLVDMRQVGAPELLSRLAHAGAAGDVPVLTLAPYASDAEWSADLERGASDALSLPLSPVALTARVGAQLRVRERLSQLRAEAVVDELTGIYNRRFMETQLAAKLGEACRYHHPFSLMIADVDHFKRVNDTLGHPFGDAVLREVAQLMQRQIRKEDVLARYGGEEFAVILPHTDRAGASVLAERVREAVAGHAISAGDVSHGVTISIGAATYPLDAVDEVSELLRCADGRLYRAKEGGRNRAVWE